MEIIRLQQHQNKFNTETENSANRNLIIENEIREIENFVNNIPVYTSPFKKEAKPLTLNKSPRIFAFGNTYIDRKIFNESFYEYLNNGKQITIERQYSTTDEAHRLKQNSVEQAIEFFKYYEWLKIQLTTKAKVKPSISLNHQEKMLALHFLGMNTKNLNDNKTAKMLSAILGLNEQNTREILGALYIDAKNNPVRTKKHFENLHKHFENIGLTEIAVNIEKEIQKLK